MHIQSQTPSKLVVVDGTFWMAIPFGILFAWSLYKTVENAALHTGGRWDFIAPLMFGLFTWATAQRTTFVFNALQRTVTGRRVQYLKVTTRTFSFDDLTDVVIDTSVTDKGGRVHRLSIDTRQGNIPMSNGYSGIGNFLKMREQILEFVKGPGAAGSAVADHEAELDSSIRRLVAQGRKIDAIKLLREHEDIGLAEAKKRIDAL